MYAGHEIRAARPKGDCADERAGSEAAWAVAPAGDPECDERRKVELLALVIRAQAGEQAAQSQLVRCYRPRLAGFVRPMVKRRDAVEDLVQVALIKMVRRLAFLREPASFESWLFILARNAVRDHFRRLHCRPVIVTDETSWVEHPDAESSLRCSEIMEALEVAARGFGAQDRRIFSQIVEGASYQSVAADERISIGALKLRVHRMRLVIRPSVRREFPMPSSTSRAALRP